MELWIVDGPDAWRKSGKTFESFLGPNGTPLAKIIRGILQKRLPHDDQAYLVFSEEETEALWHMERQLWGTDRIIWTLNNRLSSDLFGQRKGDASSKPTSQIPHKFVLVAEESPGAIGGLRLREPRSIKFRIAFAINAVTQDNDWHLDLDAPPPPVKEPPKPSRRTS